jgi:phosphopantothenoylcysteine decarboxylase/phosphopantothenate--cysteine ligase
MVAAVADWGVVAAPAKLKKARGAPVIELVANPDILASVAAAGPRRPTLVVGFAAETEDAVANAIAKRVNKGADWIVANDVAGDVMGGDTNTVHLVTADGVEDWPRLAKTGVARRLATRIANALTRTL